MRKNTSTATNKCTAAPPQFEFRAHFAPRAWCLYKRPRARAPRARLYVGRCALGVGRFAPCALPGAALPAGAMRRARRKMPFLCENQPRGVLSFALWACVAPVRRTLCGQGTQRQIYLACNKRAATLTSHDCVTLPSSSIASRSARIAAGCFCRAINCCRSASGDAAEPTSYLSRSSEFRVG